MAKWTKLLGLELWDIAVELAPDTGEADINLEAVAECMSHWQYERATIRFLQEYVDSVDDACLERTVIHELLHCVLAEMREEGAKHEERTTVNLTRAFLRLTA